MIARLIMTRARDSAEYTALRKQDHAEGGEDHDRPADPVRDGGARHERYEQRRHDVASLSVVQVRRSDCPVAGNPRKYCCSSSPRRRG